MSIPDYVKQEEIDPARYALVHAIAGTAKELSMKHVELVYQGCIDALKEAGLVIEEDWQPINPNPALGDKVYACRMHEGHVVTMGTASWRVPRPQHDGYVVNNGKPAWLTGDFEKLFPTPTHMKPLPAPPEATP